MQYRGREGEKVQRFHFSKNSPSQKSNTLSLQHLKHTQKTQHTFHISFKHTQKNRCRDRLSESLSELADIETKINRAKRTQVLTSKTEFTNSNNTADRELENLLRAANVIESSRNVTDAQMQLAVAYVYSIFFSLFF